MGRICTKCGGSGPFKKSSKSADGLRAQCKACTAAQERRRKATKRRLSTVKKRGTARNVTCKPITLPEGAIIVEAKPDDTDGRLTGAHACCVCSMRYNDQAKAINCCAPALEEYDRVQESAAKCTRNSHELILEYLIEHGEMDSDTGREVLGVGNPAESIKRLRRDGHQIETRWSRHRTESGRLVTCGTYVLHSGVQS